MSKFYMVIDEGTTGTRALIFDEKFNSIAQAYEEFTQYTPAENMVEHDAQEIFDKSVQMCKNAMDQAGLTAEDIRCIGITNQRNTCLLWDKNTGEPLYHAIVWQDSRVGDVSTAMTEDKELFNQILTTTGKVIAPHQSALILQWVLENVEGIREKVDAGDVLFGTIDCWLVWKLTEGRTHAVSFSNASSSGCMDVKNQKWYSEFFERVGVPESIFPEIKSESADYGDTTLFGAPIKITGVIADQQSALFAQGCIEPGSVKCTNGTGSFMDINIGNEFQTSDTGLDTLIAWKLGDKITYAVEGFAAVTGSAVQWLRDGLKIIKKSSEVETLAGSVPDTNGVMFVPGLIGLITPYQDPFARGLLIGISRGTTDAHIARATLEAIALRIKDILHVVEEQGIEVSAIKIDGGASEDDLLAQMIADFTGATVTRPLTVEATSLGAALMAAICMGDLTIEDVPSVMTVAATFEPQMAEADRIEKYDIWKDAVGRSMKWVRH